MSEKPNRSSIPSARRVRPFTPDSNAALYLTPVHHTYPDVSSGVVHHWLPAGLRLGRSSHSRHWPTQPAEGRSDTFPIIAAARNDVGMTSSSSNDVARLLLRRSPRPALTGHFGPRLALRRTPMLFCGHRDLNKQVIDAPIERILVVKWHL